MPTLPHLQNGFYVELMLNSSYKAQCQAHNTQNVNCNIIMIANFMLIRKGILNKARVIFYMVGLTLI